MFFVYSSVISPYPTEKHIGSSSLNLVYSESSVEVLRANSLLLEDRLDPMVLGDTEGDLEVLGLTLDINATDGTQTKSSDTQDGGYSEEMDVLEMGSPESGECQGCKDSQMPMNVDVNFQSKDPNDSGDEFSLK